MCNYIKRKKSKSYNGNIMKSFQDKITMKAFVLPNVKRLEDPIIIKIPYMNFSMSEGLEMPFFLY